MFAYPKYNSGAVYWGIKCAINIKEIRPVWKVESKQSCGWILHEVIECIFSVTTTEYVSIYMHEVKGKNQNVNINAYQNWINNFDIMRAKNNNEMKWHT